MKGRRAVVLAGVVVPVIVAVGGVVIWQHPARTGGDPGNAIYGRLHLATQAIPTTATDVRMGATQRADWTTGCPEFGAASRPGWTRVNLSATFADTDMTTSQVINDVDGALTNQGWTRHDEATSPGRGPSPHWTLRPDGGRVANLFLFPPDGSIETDWFMGVSWQPSGPIGTECP
jgi:hypothetical protein